MSEERIYVFSCGSQYDDWTSSNCDRCTKGWRVVNPDEPMACDIQEALLVACFEDGTVSPEVAARMGVSEATKGRYNWCCGEVDWTPEWKAEYTARLSMGELSKSAAMAKKHGSN